MQNNLSKKLVFLALIFIGSISLDIKVDQTKTTQQEALAVCDKPLIY